MEQYVKGFKGFTPLKMCGLSPLAGFYKNRHPGKLHCNFFFIGQDSTVIYIEGA